MVADVEKAQEIVIKYLQDKKAAKPVEWRCFSIDKKTGEIAYDSECSSVPAIT